MAAHGYWRLTGFLTDSNALELSQAQLSDGAQLIAQSPTFSVAPTSGAAFPDTLRWNDFSMPGFALTWALATPVADPNLRLGAGSSADNFPKELYCQYSDDGKFWSTNNAPTNVAFPGAGLLTAEPGATSVAVDPDFAKVSLLLQDSLVDKSANPKTVTALAAASVSTAKSKFGGASFAFLAGNDRLEVADSDSIDFGTGDFTIEFWYFPLGNRPTPCLVTKRAYNLVGVGSWRLGNTKFEQLERPTDLLSWAAPAPNMWAHIAVCRTGTALRAFINGSNVSTVSSSFNFTSTYPLTIGGDYDSNEAYADCYLDDIRITKGLGRYAANFAPPASSFSTRVSAFEFIPLSAPPAPKRWRTPSLFAEPVVGAEMSAFNLSEFTPQASFMDAYHGGNGRLYGTVKEKHAPLDIPLRREVILIDKASRLTIRVTWSDPITGDYEFIGIRMGVKYTVLAYDHFNIYRVVGADEQIPELML